MPRSRRMTHACQRDCLKAPLCGKLKNTRPVKRVDHLQRTESSPGGIRHHVTGLIERLAITTSGSKRAVLDRIHTRSVLKVKIGVIQKVKGLCAKRKLMALTKVDPARKTEI